MVNKFLEVLKRKPKVPIAVQMDTAPVANEQRIVALGSQLVRAMVKQGYFEQDAESKYVSVFVYKGHIYFNAHGKPEIKGEFD